MGINGCGRIGRKVMRLAFNRPNLRIAAINDLGDLPTLAHLLKYDSVHGTWDAEVKIEGKNLVINGQTVKVYSERDPAKLPWKGAEVELVLECTGIFTEKEDASKHMAGGARRVIVSAPSKDADIMICYGVNHESYDPSKHTVISNASCTTNCLTPVAKVIDDKFGILRGTMLTVHSYTNDQRILDLPHSDLRRARAAALSMIPTSTGAAKAVGLVLPNLKGKIDGLSIRVPTPNVSVVDFTVVVNKSTTAKEVNEVLKAASENGPLKGILGFEEAPLVSHDYNGDKRSSVIDAALTMVMEGTLVKVIAWYDNESGFSNRMLDVSEYIAQKGL
ncbi:MAG: type I glyceraldehyde-3-phosphate dehydrogenase [Bdellovibrionales bacterium]|nr:type I glyceraldehyde-3-phosphate dehydrogenase [Oligoflexia bacterium]